MRGRRVSRLAHGARRAPGPEVANLVHRADRYGSAASFRAVDMQGVLSRNRDGERPRGLHLDLFKASGAELVMGYARLTAPIVIEVSLNDGGTRVLTAGRL